MTHGVKRERKAVRLERWWPVRQIGDPAPPGGWDSRDSAYAGTCCSEGEQLRKEWEEAHKDPKIFTSEWYAVEIAHAWHTDDRLRLHADKHVVKPPKQGAFIG